MKYHQSWVVAKRLLNVKNNMEVNKNILIYQMHTDICRYCVYQEFKQG
jgi:hypothetical protein